MRPFRHLLVALAVLGAQAAPCARAAPLQLCYEDAPQPPWTMPDGRGLNFDLLKRVAALTGEQFQLNSRPWARCMEEARLGRMDGMIGAADSPERRRFSVAPQLADGSADPARALYQAHVSLFLRAAGSAAWDGKTLRNPRGSVITQRGYLIGAVLRQRGQHVIDTVKSSDEALRLLAAGGADVAALMVPLDDTLLRDDPRFRGRIVKAPQPYATFPLYLLINRASYARDPARIEAIWSAIATVRASADYRKLEAATGSPARATAK